LPRWCSRKAAAHRWGGAWKGGPPQRRKDNRNKAKTRGEKKGEKSEEKSRKTKANEIVENRSREGRKEQQTGNSAKPNAPGLPMRTNESQRTLVTSHRKRKFPTLHKKGLTRPRPRGLSRDTGDRKSRKVNGGKSKDRESHGGNKNIRSQTTPKVRKEIPWNRELPGR